VCAAGCEAVGDRPKLARARKVADDIVSPPRFVLLDDIGSNPLENSGLNTSPGVAE
jgi:hypothetical protein